MVKPSQHTGAESKKRAAHPPTETVDKDGPMKGEITRRHPAFGQISAHRVNGGHDTLYGSPIFHNGYVTIAIAESEERLALHHEWHFSKKGLIEVKLSEAQWAAFVSTMNMGSGVPCTISYAPTGPVEDRPQIIDKSFAQKKSDDIKKTVAEQMKELTEAVAFLKELTERAKPPNKTEMREALGKFLHCVEYAPGHYQFAADSVTEHTEHLITAAKAEVTSFALQAAMRWPQLAGSMPELPQIESKGDKS